MKKITINIVLLLAVLMTGLTGCYKDIIYPETVADPDGPPLPVSFKTDIQPYVAENCAKSGCHEVGGHKPYMSAEISYNQIVGGGFVNVLVPKQSTIYQMINGEMRIYIPSAVQRQKIYDWIRNGAPNN